MTSTFLARHSLKTRIVLSTLAIFVTGLWILEVYAIRMLHDDMRDLLSEQQFSMVAFMAAEIDGELDDRFRALEETAADLSPDMLRNKASLQTFLTDHAILRILFNGGTVAYGIDGIGIAQSPLSPSRIGVNSVNRDYLGGTLKEGNPQVGRPYFFSSKKFPEFLMTVPIRDAAGNVIGALGGVVNLAAPNFLKDVSEKHYGKTGDYLLIAPQHLVIVAASDNRRIMETVPKLGVNPLIDRFRQGYEGTAVMVNSKGVAVLASSKLISRAGWTMVAILPTDEAFAPIHAMRWRMRLATALLTLMVGGLSWWILRRQLSPMLTTAKMLGAMSDPAQPLRSLPIVRDDELGQLVAGFNRLLDSLQQRSQALQRSEHLLRESQSHAGLGSYALDVRTGLWKSSAELHSLFGIDETYEHSVEGWLALIHPDDRVAMTAYFKDEILGKGRDLDMVYRIIRHQDRAERWVHALGKVEFDAQMQPLEVHGTLHDISERKQAEDALRESHRQLRDLASSLQTMREEERTALARELHDEIGQQLLRLRMDLSWLAGRIKDQGPELHEKVAGMKKFIDGSVDSLRHVTTELRLPLLDDLGLAAAAAWLLDDFSQRTGIEVISFIDLGDTEMDERVTISLFRILQESLTNVARHAGATQVDVTLAMTEEGLALDVRDNGCGTEIRDKPKLGHGLVGIRERALQLGGRMEIASEPGAGFTVRVRIPPAALETQGEQT
ncbi:MAG: histidine kinase [Sulfuritalea sp.]|jgi:PAS domain S-box-containing protein|nr:histidine kinase [Sulfuritalea sp.]